VPTSKSTGKTVKKSRSPEAEIGADESPRLTVPVTSEHDHIQGSFNAPLTLVEYGDYQCPFCGAAYPEVKKVQQKLGSRLRFIFRNFPITSLHEFAERAAEAAEAASAQGRFWEMHDFLYEHQDLLGDEEEILAGAAKLSMNTQRIAEEIAQHTYLNRIKEDFSGGVRSGVNGTPTFYVNGTRYNGSPEADELLKFLTSIK